MRVLSILRARGGGGGGGGGNPSVIRATAVAAAPLGGSADGEEEGECCGGAGAGAGDDDGPFFDLEIAAVPFFEDRSRSAESEPESEGDGEGAALDIVISSEKLFADPKRGIASNAPDANPKPQFPASLLRSAARLRVFRLGFKKPPKHPSQPPPPPTKPSRGGHVLLELRVVQEVPVPVAALLARDHSARSSADAASPPSPEERRPSHRVIERCLSKIKPILHARVSRGEAAAAAPAPAESPARLRVAARRLRKSRSASSALSAPTVRSPPPPPPPVRRDDSLLEQQDGIQSAIAHCKRSLCKGSELPLVRSRSDPGDGKRNGV